MELLLTVSRDHPETLRAQIEGRLRAAIRDGSLRPGTPLPSTRDLAGQLDVSRKITVDAYAQLAAEGYLAIRQGARPRVADGPFHTADGARPEPPPPELRFDFRPSRPDVSSFPREAWARCLRDAATTISTAELGYGDPFGVAALREALADYLGRVRGVVATPETVVVTSGYLQGLGLIGRALAARGARRIALEDPSSFEEDHIAARAGLEPVRIPVDDLGLRVDLLAAAGVDAVVLTPAHQHPTGVVLAPARRSELVTWLRARHAIAIEDDYDAEYRYDRPPVGALQGLDPEHVIYCGTTSKVLAPALRLGWMVVPPALTGPLRHERMLSDLGSAARIEQLAFADFLTRGDLDRHLRKMRLRYRERRDAMVAALSAELPEARVRGIAAGLHVTAVLPPADAEAIARGARRQGIGIGTMAEYGFIESAETTLILGYSQMSEARIRAGIAELAAVVRHAGRA